MNRAVTLLPGNNLMYLCGNCEQHSEECAKDSAQRSRVSGIIGKKTSYGLPLALEFGKVFPVNGCNRPEELYTMATTHGDVMAIDLPGLFLA